MAYKIGDMVATRDAYGKALVEFAEQYDYVVLDADLAEATKTVTFKKAYPDRFFDCGIAEGNMMCVAAGLAAAGKTAFASSFAMFAAGRAYEQARNAVGYPHLNVKIGATHAGLAVGEDGATHQCLEDLALMRTIPGMTVVNPADAVEARLAVKCAIETDGPFYIRFSRNALPVVNDEENYTFELGKGVMLRDGKDVTLVATGYMVSMALDAAKLLHAEGIDARVINIHTLKPLDTEIICKAAAETGAIVTAEEHNVIGGLGAAVAQAVCAGCPVPVLSVGTQDVFGRSGKVPPLLEMYGLTPANIAENAKKAIALKK